MAVMSKSEETQSGQLLMWQPRKKGRDMGDGKKTKKKKKEIPFINVSVYSTPIFDPLNHTCIWKEIKCFYQIKAV